MELKAVQLSPLKKQFKINIMKTENTNTEIAVANTTSQTLTVQSQADLELSQFLEESTQLEGLEEQIILSSSGISLEKVGEHFNGIFWGFSTMNVKDQTTDELKEIPAVQFLVQKQIRINGGAAMVSEFKQIGLSRGAKVRVTYTKKEGNLKIYSVSLLG